MICVPPESVDGKGHSQIAGLFQISCHLLYHPEAKRHIDMRYANYGFPVPAEKQCRVIVDTDAANEGDDQFAVIQAMLSPKFENVGFIAAHFGREGSMEASFQELQRVFQAASCPFTDLIRHGAPCALPAVSEAVPSDGASLIVEEAMKDDPRHLYVLFLGLLTDLASAYLMEPRIAGRLTAIWIGGGTYPRGGREFNLGNDINAANAVFSSGIELWQVPKDVYEMMPVSLAELEYRLLGSDLGTYLFNRLMDETYRECTITNAFRTGETWVLGDSPAVGLVLYEHRWEYDLINAPAIGKDMEYIRSDENRPIRVYRRIDSRLILEDMYAKIALFDPKGWEGASY